MSQDATIAKPDVIICGPDATHLAKLWGSHGGWECTGDGPTSVVIGPKTSDQACIELAARFELDAGALKSLRNDRIRGVDSLEVIELQ